MIAAIENSIEEAAILLELAEAENSPETANEAGGKLTEAEGEIHKLDIQRMLGEEQDRKSVV